MKIVGLLFFLIAIVSCQVVRPPDEIPPDKALISNALFYNGEGDYQDSTFYFSVQSYNGKNTSNLYSSYTEIHQGNHKFLFRCVRQPASGTSWPESTQNVEAGKCYIPTYKKAPEHHGYTCKNDAAGKFTQYSNSCGVGGRVPYVSGGCAIELKEIPCGAFKKLGRANTPNEVKEAIAASHNKSINFAPSAPDS